jgi:hypothetical protein
MPRKGRGGSRQGASGKAYAQRSDLNENRQAVVSPPSQEYGQRVALERQQAAMPMAEMSRPTPLFAPSERADEPVTAGLPMGAGPGPEVLPGGGDPTVARLRALYALHPSPDLRRLLAWAEGTGDPSRGA